MFFLLKEKIKKNDVITQSYGYGEYFYIIIYYN